VSDLGLFALAVLGAVAAFLVLWALLWSIAGGRLPKESRAARFDRLELDTDKFPGLKLSPLPSAYLLGPDNAHDRERCTFTDYRGDVCGVERYRHIVSSHLFSPPTKEAP